MRLLQLPSLLLTLAALGVACRSTPAPSVAAGCATRATGVAGDCSITRWALVPLTPNELIPATRRSPRWRGSRARHAL